MRGAMDDYALSDSMGMGESIGEPADADDEYAALHDPIRVMAEVLRLVGELRRAADRLGDAIVKAGSLNPQAINTAIGQTNKTYVAGPINFAKGPGGHTSPLPSFMLQWQHGQTQIVYPPKLATAKLVYPLPPW